MTREWGRTKSYFHYGMTVSVLVLFVGSVMILASLFSIPLCGSGYKEAKKAGRRKKRAAPYLS